MTNKPAYLTLRLDDPGASSKRYEVYSNWNLSCGPIKVSGNWLFLKYLQPFRAWGPYREITPNEWCSIIDILDSRGAKLTVGVTAAWARSEQIQIPFDEMFPEQAEILRSGARGGTIEIANHGYVHCVLEKNLFKPKLWSGNRQYHREFWECIPDSVQEFHIIRSQEILQNWLGLDVVTFIPPGNVFSDSTLELAHKHGLRYLSCHSQKRPFSDLTFISSENVIAFHDREIVHEGIGWFIQLLDRYRDASWLLAREMGDRLKTREEA